MPAMAVAAVLLAAMARADSLAASPSHGAKVAANATESKANPCACKNFAEVYFDFEKHGTTCGRGHELYFLSKNGFSASYAATEPISGLPHQVCYDFFKNYIETACVNVDLKPFPQDGMSDTQWCYVSNECTELNNGRYATNQQGFAQSSWYNLHGTSGLNIKHCKSGEDRMLRDMDIQSVIEIGRDKDLGMSKLFRLAYPAVEIDWPEASFFYLQLDEVWEAGKTMAEIVAKVEAMDPFWDPEEAKKEDKLREIAVSNQPYVLDSIGHGDDFHVVSGREVYEVKRLPDDIGNMAYLNGHFFREFEVQCILGCAQAQERHGPDLVTM